MTYVPGWGAVVGLGGVVPSFAVATQEKDLVFYVAGRVFVELQNLVVEALPLGQVIVMF